MKHIDIKDKTVQGQYEYFDSLQDFIKTVDSRKVPTWYAGSEPTREEHNYSFSHVSGYDEARNYLLHGWDAEVPAIAKAVKKQLMRNQSERKTIVSDVQGFCPIVPAALAGVPNSMMNFRAEKKNAKVINLLVDFVVSGSVPAEDVISVGTKMLAKVQELENDGYRVRITCIDAFNNEHGRKVDTRIASFLLKSENQPMNIKKMAFPLFHPAMLRTMMFDWYERLEDNGHFDGYGVPMYSLEPCNRQAIVDFIGKQDHSNIKQVYVNYKNVKREFIQGTF